MRDPDSSSYVATFEPAEHFGVLVEAEARRRGADQAGCVVVLGDGSPWVWNLAESHFPTATHIVDLYDAPRAHPRYGQADLPHTRRRYHRWVEDRIAALDAGDVEGLCDAARGLKLPIPAGAAVEAALAYFETNTERMRYATFRAAGHFVGSGTVESGFKAVIGQRLKLSGMRWAEHGASGIAALRCQEASGRWDQSWLRLDNQTSVA